MRKGFTAAFLLQTMLSTSVVMAAPPTGILAVTATPAESAHLELVDPNGRKQLSGAAYANKKAAVGTWKVTARAAGYGDQEATVEVVAGDAAGVDLELKKVGALHVTGSPEGCAVTVTGPDGFRKESTLPWNGAGLTPGTYRLLVTHSGFQTVEREVRVASGEVATSSVTLLQGINTSGRATTTAPSEGGGKLSSSAVQDVIQEHNGEYRYCYEKELSKDANLAGTVMVHLQVDPVGYVIAADVVETDLHNDSVESCLLSVVKRWKFPQPRGGKVADVSYPFSFNSK